MQEKNNGEVYLATTESEKDRGWIKCGMTTRSAVEYINQYPLLIELYNDKIETILLKFKY
jgi:hypothetical protein